MVILPLTTIKDNEVYAPNYKDGETVALIRYPHGGTFEIPILKVNNKLAEGKSVLGNTPADAIGINKKNADRLSGADFDGDTVMVIPCNSSKSKVKITSTHSLKGLEDFDTKDAYGPDSSKPVKVDSKGKEYYTRNGRTYQRMTNTQTEMGKISNLITDMTLKGATEPELAKAVRHSMVVIDAQKHKLDYKQSEIDNDIATLKKKYQGTTDSNGHYHEGASTLISRAKSETSVLKRKGSPSSASAANTSAANAKSYADSAASSKNAAASSASNASASATNAKKSETAAANSASLAQAAYEEILGADVGKFGSQLANEHSVLQPIYDSSGQNICDSSGREIQGRIIFADESEVVSLRQQVSHLDTFIRSVISRLGYVTDHALLDSDYKGL